MPSKHGRLASFEHGGTISYLTNVALMKARRSYAVWFLKNGRMFSTRSVNAHSLDGARAEAQRRVDEQGVIGIEEGGREGYIFGHPGITVGSIVEEGDATELGDRDLRTELENKGLILPVRDPDIPF